MLPRPRPVSMATSFDPVLMTIESKGAVGQYHSNLQAAGIDRRPCSDTSRRNVVDVVIISHFHGDHINGLVGPENKPAFPNAEIMVPEVEAAFWADEGNAARLPEPMRPQMGNVKRVMGIVGGKVTKYQAGKELVPGITAIASTVTRPATPRILWHRATARFWCRAT
jgi:glyoxylase-like metal-dependent hydrolase (beta-lactamase superfamily II)